MSCFCASNPCSVPLCTGPCSGGVSCGASLYCTVMSDTAGVVYRAFSARPTWLGGTGKPTTDPWTKNILREQETAQLIQAGANPCDAAKQAACDVNDSLQLNCADPCKPATPPMSITTMILLIGAAAIVLVVGTNAFVSKEL